MKTHKPKLLRMSIPKSPSGTKTLDEHPGRVDQVTQPGELDVFRATLALKMTPAVLSNAEPALRQRGASILGS